MVYYLLNELSIGFVPVPRLSKSESIKVVIGNPSQSSQDLAIFFLA